MDDDVRDEYDDIAKVIDTCDDEHDPLDAKSNHVTSMLTSLINNTAAYLEEQDDEKDAENGKESDSTLTVESMHALKSSMLAGLGFVSPILRHLPST